MKMKLDLNEARVYSKDNISNKIKDGAYVINLDDEYSDIGTYWIALYVNAKNGTYFDSFGVEHIPKEIKKSIKRSINKFTIVTNIFRIQAYDSVVSIRFTDFMFKRKSLTNFTNLFLPNDFKKMMI